MDGSLLAVVVAADKGEENRLLHQVEDAPHRRLQHVRVRGHDSV